MFFKSFQFSSELCFLGESWFEAQRRIKIFNFTNETYHYRNFFYENIKQFFYETNFFWNIFFNETIFYAVSKKSYQSSLTSFTTYSTLAITKLKLLRGSSESARDFGDPIYARRRRRAKEPSPVAFKKTIDIKFSTDDSCHA